MTHLEPNTEKLDFKRILPVLAIVLVDLLGLSIIVPLLALYAARYGANAFIIGLLGATYPLMQFIGAPILGRLSDRFGRKPILVISQLGTLAGFILLGFANALWLLFLSRIIDGLSGANLSTAQTVMADLTTEKTRTQGLGLIGAAFGVGFILGPIIAFSVLLATGGSYQAVAFAAAFFSLLSIILTFTLLKETLPAEQRGHGLNQKAGLSFGAMRESLTRPVIGLLLVLMFAQQLAFGGYEQLFSLFALNRLGMDATSTAGLFVLAGLFIVVVQAGLIGRWSKQKGDRWLVMLGLSTLALGLVLTSFTPQIPVPWYDQAKVQAGLRGDALSQAAQTIQVQLPDQSKKGWFGIVWILIASFPAALGGGVLHPAINSLITQSADRKETGSILGISAAFYSAANAAAPLFYGSLFQWFGPPVPFLLGGILLGGLWWTATHKIH
ncbi:MAG TPA: MFS transporter [Anaerolineales bacterium]|nr:MFS transporter [Anaerolineales bacterium]